MRRTCLIIGLVALAAFASGQTDGYSKLEFRIPMRDGVKLYTQVFVPRDVADDHPILLERTPYGAGPVGRGIMRSGFAGSPSFVSRGYIFAYQDVRGRFASEGVFVNNRPQLNPGEKGIDESTDAYDTIDFLVQNVPSNNGNVGIWGVSYPGFYAALAGVNGHPALRAISPQAPVSDWFNGDDVHHNGAFFLQDTFEFALAHHVPRGTPTPLIDRQDKSAYQFYLDVGALPNFDAKLLKGRIPYWNDELMANETRNEYWRARAMPPQLRNISAAILNVGGWFDCENLYGALQTYAHAERQNPRADNFLVMGPWWHGMWTHGDGRVFGDLDFQENTSTFFREELEFRFFERYLRGQLSISAPAEAMVFETGTNRWRSFATWPPQGTSSYDVFLNSDRKLSTQKTENESSTSYINDPAAPTPYVANWLTSRKRPIEYMIADQTHFSTRADVATYVSEPLTEDIRVGGPIDVDLWVKTTGTDADLVVKVIDVWPKRSSEVSPRRVAMANYQQLLRGDVIRVKFRNSFEKPEPFLPGVPTKVTFKLNDVLHNFRAGHSLMVQVQSSWFPLVDRNPNTFTNIRRATDQDFQKATITILQGGEHASRLRFQRLPN